MRKIDYKEGRELEETHVCKECGGGLVTVWCSLHKHHATKCSENADHYGEVRKGSIKYHEQPQEIKNMLDRRERIRKE